MQISFIGLARPKSIAFPGRLGARGWAGVSCLLPPSALQPDVFFRSGIFATSSQKLREHRRRRRTGVAEVAGRDNVLLEGAGEGRRLTEGPRWPVLDPGAGQQGGRRPARASPALSLCTEGRGPRSPWPAVRPPPPHRGRSRAQKALWSAPERRHRPLLQSDPGKPPPPRTEDFYLLKGTEHAALHHGRLRERRGPISPVLGRPHAGASSSFRAQNRQPGSAFLREQMP